MNASLLADGADLERRFGGLRRLYGDAGYQRLRSLRVAVQEYRAHDSADHKDKPEHLRSWTIIISAVHEHERAERYRESGIQQSDFVHI